MMLLSRRSALALTTGFLTRAACAAPVMHTEVASRAEMTAYFSGKTFTFEAGQDFFGADGSLSFLSADGNEVGIGTWSVLDTADGHAVLALQKTYHQRQADGSVVTSVLDHQYFVTLRPDGGAYLKGVASAPDGLLPRPTAGFAFAPAFAAERKKLGV